MRRYIIIALAIICLTCGFIGVDAITTNGIRSSGLDFWNCFAESAQLESMTEKSRDLDGKIKEQKRRSEMINSIAITICNGHITLSDGIELIHRLLENSPYKRVDLRTGYIYAHYLRPEATERDVYACFLLITIKSLQLTSEIKGDRTSAAFFSDRLIHSYEEIVADSQGLLPAILDPLH
jgi:hypothetical protein